jgi:signal transduction histidine kinase
MSQRFEWSRTGVSPQIDNPALQSIPYEPMFEGLYDILAAGKASRRMVRDLAEPERRLMMEQGIQSLLLVPITVNGRLWGFVGFDDCHHERLWSEEEELILFAMAGSVGAAVERRLTERQLEARDRLLRGAALATASLLTSDNLDQGLRRALHMLGEAAQVERVCLFENRRDSIGGEPLMHVRYVWQRGHSTFTPPTLPDRVYAQSCPGWYAVLNQGVSIAGRVLDFIDPADAAEESPRVRSVLVVPVITQNEFWGFLGFDDGRLDRVWVDADESILKAVAGSLGGAIVREHVESELRVSEDRLRHSQKMEAVGRLAGGVAHDFNNLLTAIMGYAELILNRLDPADPVHCEVEEISKAAERAHSVTRQLLAFSRKQVLEPRVVNLNNIVADMERLLRRLIGENIELATHLERRPCLVRVDRNQIEQVIINLAVNARDAMPRGGKLSIETSRVHLTARSQRGPHALDPGHYIALFIRDTGEGMGDEVKAHVFEPFFTTKKVGEGTGLGLSMVYGIVEQSGGRILFDSEVGHGTTFSIYLPDLREEAVEPPVQQSAAATGGSETVLLVEDEEIVRELARRVLLQFGYQVLIARNGRDALDMIERDHTHIDLLLTDMVMPHMTGRALAHRLGARFPGLRVLYMSGYTQEAIDDIADLGPNARFIQKPFSPSHLARHVRELLDKR